jgi:hypothetical protein
MKLRHNKTVTYAIVRLEEVKQALGRPESVIALEMDVERYPEVLAAKVRSYLSWVSTAEERIRDLFADTDLVEGLHEDRFWRIGQLKEGWVFAPNIITDEIKHQRHRLTEAIETLRKLSDLGDRPGELLALDTNAFLQYRPYDEIPWRELLRAEHVRLILTMPTLDEIEAKKQGSNPRLKKRARKILPRIDKAFGGDSNEFVQVERGGKPVNGVTLEILHDPPGHRRTSTDMDEEFLDRCEFLHQATGRPVIVVTADTGMKVRARGRGEAAGLQVLTLPEEYRLKGDDENDETLDA